MKQSNEENSNNEVNLSLLNNSINNTDKGKDKEYQYGLDLIRFLAMYFVLVFHSYIANNYRRTKIVSFQLFLIALHRYISYTCNCLFMLLTGYLQKEKKPTISYFSKLLSFILEYLLCTFVVILYQVQYLKIKVTNEQIIDKFFQFKTPDYAWYVKMFIGLFLFSPYLNILYNNITTASLKYTLIIVLIIITTLPDSFYRFTWNYWISFYPVMYYFIGCFIREFQPKIRKIYLIIWIILIDILQVLNKKYNVHVTVDNFQNVGDVLLSTSIFLLFYDLKAKRQNCFLKIFRHITDTSLSCFLLSCIFESVFEINLFRKKGLVAFVDRFPYLLFTVPVNLTISIIMGLFTHNISMLLVKIIHYYYDKLRELTKN